MSILSSNNRIILHAKLPNYARYGSWLIGIELFILARLNYLENYTKFIDSTSDWAISAIMLAGAMAGFAAASLAIVAALSTSEKAREIVESESGGFLINALLRSVWLWLLSAIAPVAWFCGYKLFAPPLLIGFIPICLVQTFIASYAFHLLFQRYLKR